MFKDGSRWVLAGALALQTFLHLFWLSIPMTGGQITVPWLMSQGMTLFGDVIENRAPLTAVWLALVNQVSPLTPLDNVRLMNLLLVLLITVLVYALARQLSGGDGRAAGIAVLFWVAWEPVYANLAFYFDTVLGLFILLAIVAWIRLGPGWPAALASGALLGAGVLAKQHGWAAVGMFGLWLLVFRRKEGPIMRELAAYSVGALALPALSVLIFAVQGNLSAYLYFTYTYNLSGYITPSPVDGNFIRKLLLTNALAPIYLLLMWRGQGPLRAQRILLGMMYLAALLPLVPHLGEIHAATHLPLLAVMTGLVIPQVASGWGRYRPRTLLRDISPTDAALMGIGGVVLLAWSLTVIAPLFHAPLGRGKSPGYHEFTALAQTVVALKEEGDTLEVLPKLSGSSSLFEMTGLRSPGLWAYSDASFYYVPGLAERILADWSRNPPRIVVYFPQLQRQYVGSAIDPLVDFVLKGDYEQVAVVEAVMFNGDALVYRWRGE